MGTGKRTSRLWKLLRMRRVAVPLILTIGGLLGVSAEKSGAVAEIAVVAAEVGAALEE